MASYAAGGTSKTIGRKLGISARTVEIYAAQAKVKLRAATMPHAVALYLLQTMAPGDARSPALALEEEMVGE
jgi:DNA-binding CsgD family transcriptional regulator